MIYGLLGLTLTFSNDGHLLFSRNSSLLSELRVYTLTVDGLALYDTTTLGDCLKNKNENGFLYTCAFEESSSTAYSHVSSLKTGLLYEGWHGPPAYSLSLVERQGGAPLCIEDILQSGSSSSPNLTIRDIYDKYPGVSQETFGFFYQEHPSLGYYCIYRKRSTEATGLIPDCVNISGTLAAQNEMIQSATVDFITVDGTNLCTPSAQEDLIQQRPMEVVLEEFYSLRTHGTPTPRVAAWQRLVVGCTTYPAVLALYNNASYVAADLFLTAPGGKRVFFVPSDPDPTLVSEVESNGGRNDIVVQVMWALMPKSSYDSGEWGFMSPCIDTATGGYTTNVVGLGRGATGCGQRFTYNSTLGSVASVSPSFQLSYGSVPFSAAGKFNGVTLQRQFGTIFDRAAAVWVETGDAVGALPDNIYISSWNGELFGWMCVCVCFVLLFPFLFCALFTALSPSPPSPISRVDCPTPGQSLSQ